MALRYGLLGLLNYGPMTGYELDKAFKASLNFFWQAQTSQIYRELKAMQEAGLLTSALEIQTSKPNKKLYSITDAGREALRGWLAQSSPEEALKVRSEFLMRLFFSSEMRFDESRAMLSAFKASCAQGLEALAQTQDSIAQYGGILGQSDSKHTACWGLTARFGEAYMHMCLQFADEAIGILEAYR